MLQTAMREWKKAADRGGGKNSVQVLHFISYLLLFFCVQLKNSLREKFFAEDDEGVGEGKKVAAAARKS